MANEHSFDQREALRLWSRIVAGWADHLDESGARLIIDGVTNPHDAGGSYEGVTRMLWGLGGWLSAPGRPASITWRGAEYNLLELTRQAILNGTDPDAPGYWGVPAEPGAADQRTVESGQVAFALWQSRHLIWDTLDRSERDRIVNWLDACGKRPAVWRNNWALFWAINHCARRALEVSYDPSIVPDVLDYLDTVYCGDGWYEDGPTTGTDHFDDYNLWVFGSHVLAWSRIEGADDPDRRDLLLNRVRGQMRHLPHFFAANGAYTEYGRSLSYKFARLGAPIWAYQQGCWPHSAGMLKRLVGRHLRWYADRGAIRADGTLSQALTSEGSLEVRETYISTGATYWAMQAFGALWSLPDDDPFWTAAEEPLPVEQGDFTRVLPQPGFVLVGTQATGAIQRFTARSHHMPAKYSKFHYTTIAPFNAGLVNGGPAPDAMLCLTDGVELGHKDTVLASAVGEPGWLRFRYQQTLGGSAHTIETVIVTHGEMHVRVHRIVVASETSILDSAIEGAAAFGFPAGSLPVAGVAIDPLVSWVSDRASTVAIAAIRGYIDAQPPSSFGHEGIHSVYGKQLVPLLAAGLFEDTAVLVSVVHIGARLEEPMSLVDQVTAVDLRDDGVCLVHWSDGMTVTVPPLE